MLSSSEILELEKKVFRYRIKKRLHHGIALILFLGLIGISISFYSIKKTHTESTEKNITTSLFDDSNKTIPNEINDLNTQKNVIEEILMLQSPHVIIGKTSLQKEFTTPMEEEVIVKTIDFPQDKTLLKPNDGSIDMSVLAPPPLEEIKQKGVVKIESQEINSIHYLKEKFEKTNNIIFALMLAEEYYLSKDYIQSNKWALIANQLDADNEKSWLWFAKSKVKLGQKEDAIVALKAYIKNNKSKTAQTLLNQIYLGEIHE